jgi:hypothetical protein
MVGEILVLFLEKQIYTAKTDVGRLPNVTDEIFGDRPEKKPLNQVTK